MPLASSYNASVAIRRQLFYSMLYIVYTIYLLVADALSRLLASIRYTEHATCQWQVHQVGYLPVADISYMLLTSGRYTKHATVPQISTLYILSASGRYTK